MGSRFGLGILFLLGVSTSFVLAEPVGIVFDGRAVTINGAPAQKSSPFNEGDLVKTGGAPAFVQLNFNDKSTVKLGPNSELRIVTKSKKMQERKIGLFKRKSAQMMMDVTVLDLNFGKALIKVEGFKKKSATFEVRTPTAVAGVRGTVFTRSYTPPQGPNPEVDTCTVLQGKIEYYARNIPDRKIRIIRKGRQSKTTGNTEESQPSKKATKEVLDQEIEDAGGQIDEGAPGEGAPDEGGPDTGKGPTADEDADGDADGDADRDAAGREKKIRRKVQKALRETVKQEIINNAKESAKEGTIENVVEEARQNIDLPVPPTPPPDP